MLDTKLEQDEEDVDAGNDRVKMPPKWEKMSDGGGRWEEMGDGRWKTDI